MVHAAASHPDFVLKAAADPHPTPREAFARDHNARGYSDIATLVADPAVDVVYVATPHQFHARHASESPAMLKRLQQAVIDNRNVFEVLMDAVRVCSLGQVTNALFEVGGQYRRSM